MFDPQQGWEYTKMLRERFGPVVRLRGLLGVSVFCTPCFSADNLRVGKHLVRPRRRLPTTHFHERALVWTATMGVCVRFRFYLTSAFL